MTKDEALKLALDYLERHAIIDGIPVRDAIKEVLAQPEPVANEQDAFEQKFSTPANCTRFIGGYAPTSYNAWDAHAHSSRWEGWKARADASPPQRQPLKRATIADAPDCLNTNDKAMWVIGWNECVEAHSIGDKT